MSFRTRLFLVASGIVALVLMVVLALGWSRVMIYEVDRLDARLCQEVRRLAQTPLRPDEMERFETDLLGKLRLVSTQQLMLQVQPDPASEAVQTRNWNDAARGAAFVTLPTDRMAAGPPPRPPNDQAPPGDEPDANAAPPPQRQSRPQPPPAMPPPRGDCATATLGLASADWRVARLNQSGTHAWLAVDLAATERELRSALRSALALVVPLALVLTALAAALLAHLTLRPLNRLREAMKSVTQKALDQRLPSSGEDREFQELIAAYNTMLGRLQASFEQASRFSADAAHELKTPLTILQGQIEQAMLQADSSGLQVKLAELLTEVGHLSAITRKLLLLAQADAGRLALNRSRINLSEQLDNWVADTQMLAAERSVSSDVEPGLQVSADALLLRQLFNNLLSNAVRYGGIAGWIHISARALPDGVEVVIANASPAIGMEQRQRFFDRFYRGDASRNRRSEGSGLGLSLAREIARAHGGDLTLQSSRPDQVRLRLWLPTP